MAAKQNYDVVEEEIHGTVHKIENIFNGENLPESEEINEISEVETTNHDESDRDEAIIIDKDNDEDDEIGNSRGEEIDIYNEINEDTRQQSMRVPTKNSRCNNEDMVIVMHEGGGGNGIISSEHNTDRAPKEGDDVDIVVTVLTVKSEQRFKIFLTRKGRR